MYVNDGISSRFPELKISLAGLVFGLVLLVAEEARYGYVLGLSDYLCQASGGKFTPAQGRCITRACYWFGDCGYWAAPAWRDQVALGDPISKVVFWLGEPAKIDGDTYRWPYGKGGGNRFFSARFQAGRLIELNLGY